MTKRQTIVFEDGHIQVIHSPAKSSYALATFNTRDEKANDVNFWGKSFTEKYGIECFGFVSKRANWFPSVSMQIAASALGQLTHKPLIGYGHSMGGFGCLKYSAMFGFSGVLSSGPQISIGGDIIPHDVRYMHHYDVILNDNMAIKAVDLHGRLLIVFDPYHQEDRLHAEAILALDPAAQSLKLPFMQHRTVFAIKPRQFIMPFCEAIVAGGPLPSFAGPLRERRAYPNHYNYIGRQLLQRGKFRTALNVLKAAPPTTEPNYIIERDLYVGRTLAKLCRFDEAAELFQSLVIREPGNKLFEIELTRIRGHLARFTT